MDETASPISHAPDFELPNVAAGPDPFSLSGVASDPAVDGIVLLFQRDYHCINCRKQVQAVSRRYEEFQALDVTVASILPEPRARAQSWQESYDLSFPLLADPDIDVGDAYDQPVRFGVLGSLHDFFGRMPVALVLDTRTDNTKVSYTYEGRMPADRPDVDELLDELRSMNGE